MLSTLEVTTIKIVVNRNIDSMSDPSSYNVAIIIGFSYKKRLAGVIVDMYKMYNYAVSIGLKPYIFTDYTEDPKLEEIDNLVRNSTVDCEILTFISRVKPTNILGREELTLVLLSLASSATSKYNKLFFYYTGHGDSPSISTGSEEPGNTSDAGVVLPNGDIYVYEELLHLLDNLTAKDAEIALVLDCCRCSLTLPYILTTKISTIDSMDPLASMGSTHSPLVSVSKTHSPLASMGSTHKYSFRLTDVNKIIYSKPILLFTASTDNEQTYSTSAGSWFTKRWLNSISMYGLGKIMSTINDTITPNEPLQITGRCYASYPISNIIWSWLLKYKNQGTMMTRIELDITGDLLLCGKF